MQTFTKAERLCSKVVIDKAFETGKTVSVPLFRLIWLKAEAAQPFPLQILISVPKRNFKKAVDRNLLKRRIREAYRKNKSGWYEQLVPEAYTLLLIYTGKQAAEYKAIEEKIMQLMARFIAERKSNAVL